MLRFILAFMALLAAGATNASALEPTPPQTEGPFYPRQLPAERDADLTRVGNRPVALGEVLKLDARVVDTTGAPIDGARVEIWQVDHHGIYLHPGDPGFKRRDAGFQGYGEARTGSDGRIVFVTIRPPAYEGRPRHIHVKVTPPGGATLTTQLYFADDPLLARDAISRRLGKALEQVTLRPLPAGSGGGLEAQITLVVPGARR